MTRNDIERLRTAASELADELRKVKLSSLRIKNKILPEPTDNDGWSVDIARWPGQPNIAVTLDNYTRALERAFWVGFWASESEPIKSLYEGMPEPALTFYNEDADPQNWLLRQPLTKLLFGCSIAEFYEGENKYFGYYDSSENLDIARAVAFISDVVLGLENGADEETVDIELIKRNSDLSGTERDQLIRARRGQGIFRQRIEEVWKGRCPITRHEKRELLRASHIKPWRLADTEERMDQYNGILLSANLDALFDQYLISFADDGSLMISDLLPENEVRRLRLSHETNIRLKDEHKVYLKHHRMQFETKRSRGPVA